MRLVIGWNWSAFMFTAQALATECHSVYWFGGHVSAACMLQWMHFFCEWDWGLWRSNILRCQISPKLLLVTDITLTIKFQYTELSLKSNHIYLFWFNFLQSPQPAKETKKLEHDKKDKEHYLFCLLFTAQQQKRWPNSQHKHLTAIWITSVVWPNIL